MNDSHRRRLLNRHGPGGLAAGILMGICLTSGFVQAEDSGNQRTVNILDEPRHRVVFRDEELWLLDIQINPGDTTLPHTHDSAILYTFISNGEGPLYGRVSSNTSYATDHYTHQVSNPGPELFRIIALASYGAGRDAEKDVPARLNSETVLENEWFRSYRLELEVNESSTIQLGTNPSAIIQVTDGLVHISREDGITAELDGMGAWTWREAGSAYSVHNAGNIAVSVVINEALK